jgi:hypothetical protein
LTLETPRSRIGKRDLLCREKRPTTIQVDTRDTKIKDHARERVPFRILGLFCLYTVYRQKRPSIQAKETYYAGKTYYDACCIEKRPNIQGKETYFKRKRDLI